MGRTEGGRRERCGRRRRGGVGGETENAQGQREGKECRKEGGRGAYLL